jgi:disulfide bond formation protein DsbB
MNEATAKQEIFIRRHALYFAWVVALAGFCLSIYFGEVLRHEPCPLCWYQRIALFPLVFLLGIAAYRNDRGIVPYALPFSCLGAVIALFQILDRYMPILQKSGVCHFGDTCTKSPFSFSMVSAAGFFLITALLFLLVRNTNPSLDSRR